MQNQVQLATNLGRGGVSALILSGSAMDIEAVDFEIESIKKRGTALQEGELIYGIIKDKASSHILDEVVVAAYSTECRIITGHGGSASALALLNHFISLGFEETDEPCHILYNKDKTDKLLNGFLVEAKTEYQALSCLQTINMARAGKDIDLNSIVTLMRPRIVVLAGAPNVGKSSLLNILCGFERVLVSNIAGTTRDAVRDYIDIGGYYTHLIDTAGFRSNSSDSEAEAIRRGRSILTTADVVLLVLDSSREVSDDDLLAIEAVRSSGNAHIIPVLNKTDITQKIKLTPSLELDNPTSISCTKNEGIQELLHRISTQLQDTPSKQK